MNIIQPLLTFYRIFLWGEVRFLYCISNLLLKWICCLFIMIHCILYIQQQCSDSISKTILKNNVLASFSTNFSGVAIIMVSQLSGGEEYYTYNYISVTIPIKPVKNYRLAKFCHVSQLFQWFSQATQLVILEICSASQLFARMQRIAISFSTNLQGVAIIRVSQLLGGEE